MAGRRRRLATLLLSAIAAVGLSACGSDTTPRPTGSATTGPAVTGTVTAAADAGCVLLTATQAATILGEPIAWSKSVATPADTGAVHVDGCGYGGNPSYLIYDVSDYAKVSGGAKARIEKGRATIIAMAGADELFAPALGDDSIGAVSPADSYTFSQVLIAAGTRIIVVTAVASTATGAKQMAVAAGRLLVAG